MEQVRKRRSGVAVVIFVLVVVGAFWLLVITHTSQYQAYRREADLKKTLQAIQPPAGAKRIDIIITGAGEFRGWTAIEAYSSDLTADVVKSHYMQEFPRRGFIYRSESTKKSQTSLDFCSARYGATLTFTDPEVLPHLYFINLSRRHGPC